jgi:hypothetical protein
MFENAIGGTMKKIAVSLVVGLLVIGLVAIVGCGGEPEVEGHYLNPEGGKLELKTGGTMSLTKIPGATTIKGTYEVRDGKLSLYGPGQKTDKPLMTFRIEEDRLVELIDVYGLIWIRQPAE